MSTRETCKVTVENTTLEVPVIQNPKYTQELGESITERMFRISSERKTLNTHHIIIQAAIELEHELRERQRAREADDQQLIRACSRLTERVRALAAAYEAPLETESEEADE
ncbi:MAG TPA: cell division protein ZapA [Candidatus Hydrogenedentes bacterium]|nr:cell division protein ZapA [Candidatus Hydrogenedentota bacterium]